MRDLSVLRRLVLRVNIGLGYLSAALTLVMMLIVVYDVIARLAFRAPTLWVIDISEYLLVYVTFLPAAWILLKDGHVKVDLLVSGLEPRTQRLMGVAGDVMGLFYCLVLTWQSWLVARDALEKGYRFSTALSFPTFPVLIIIPLGAAWLALTFIIRLSTSRGGSQEQH